MPEKKASPTTVFPPLLIRASAGTGKTFQLTNRLIRLLAHGEQPERIFASTFTRKAAGEIQNRLYRRLAEAALDPAQAKRLAAEIDEPALTAGRAAELLCRLVAVQHRMAVCTLESFFAGIARQFALEIGLPLDWRISEEAESDRQREQAVAKVCAAAARSNDQKLLAGLVQIYDKENASQSVYRKMLQAVSELHGYFRVTDAKCWDWLEPPSFVSEQRLASAKEFLAAFEIPQNASKKTPNAHWQKAIEQLRQLVENHEWQAVLENGLLKKVVEGETRYARHDVSPDLQEVLEVFLQQAAAQELTILRNQTRAAYELLKRFDEFYQEAKLESGSLRFEDVKFLLSETATAFQLSDIYYRLDARLSHMLLDEFQDTAPDQWQILAPLADEVLSQSGYQRSFFCVGDVKQAIYGWRGGRADLFDAIEARYPLLERQELTASYRSSQVVIDIVNTVFGFLGNGGFLPEVAESAAAWLEGFSEHRTERTELAGYFELRSLPSAEQGENLESEKEQEQDIQEIRGDLAVAAAAETVQTIMQQAPAASIGVLLRKNKRIAPIIAELRRVGIVASEEGGNYLCDVAAIRLMYSVLRFADHPGDSAALFDLRSSPLARLLDLAGAVEQPDTASRRIREKLLEEGYASLFSACAAELAASCSSLEQRRLTQLIEFGYELDLQPGLRPSTAGDLLIGRKVEDPSAAAVRVMTVHQSKGLEFDAVVLPELEIGLFGGFSRPAMLIEQQDPLQPPSKIIRYPNKQLRKLSEELESLYQSYDRGQLFEALSILYVALTRAKHAIYAIVPAATIRPGKAVPKTFAGLLCSAFEVEQSEPETVLHQQGDSDWGESLPEAVVGSAESSKQSPSPVVCQKGRRRFLPRKTPSSLEGSTLYTHPSEAMQLGSAVGRQYGLALHRFFEQIDWLDELAEEEVQGLRSLAEGPLLNGENLQQRLSKSHYAGENCEELFLYREFPFAIREEEYILTGSFDRLVIGCHMGQARFAHLLDFKSDSVQKDDSAELARRVELYRPQISAYRSAISRLSGLPQEAIRAELFFVGIDRAISL